LPGGAVKGIKVKKTEVGDGFRVRIGPGPDHTPAGNDRYTVEMLWDTGATSTSISDPVARMLGVIKADGSLGDGITEPRTGQRARNADGSYSAVRMLRNVPLTLTETGEVVRAKTMVGEGDSLFGASHIRKVKSMKLKFRPAAGPAANDIVGLPSARERARKTCKVVLDPDSGGGARVYPRGCKVRWSGPPVRGAAVHKYAKATGQPKARKIRHIEVNSEFYVPVTGTYRNAPTQGVLFVWDTGASDTTMSEEDAKALGILTPETGQVSSRFQSDPTEYEIADGRVITGGKVVYAVPLRVHFNSPLGVVDEEVVGDVIVAASGGDIPALFGVSHIKHIKTFKLKFRRARARR
jgi:hypothetical protein